MKRAPQSKDELKALVSDKSVNLGEIDISKITDLSNLFADSKRVDFSGIESWDTKNVTDMHRMFENCHTFNENIESWDVSRVTQMQYMFQNATRFNRDLGAWNVANVRHISEMFSGASSFKQNLNAWKFNNLLSANDVFKNSPMQSAKSTLAKWYKKPVKIDGKYRPVQTWQLRMLIKNPRANLAEIDTSKITNMSHLFYYDKKRRNYAGLETWDVSRVENMCGAFAYSAMNVDISGWDVSRVRDMNMMFMHTFFNRPLNAWNVAAVENMSYMFSLSEFNKPLDSWNVGRVKNMEQMFCAGEFKQDVSMWDVGRVENISGMFMHTQIALDSKLLKALESWGKKLPKGCNIKDAFYYTNQILGDKASNEKILPKWYLDRI